MKKLLSGVLCLAVVCGVGYNATPANVVAEDNLQIWYADSETYVYKTQSYEERDTSALKIFMAKNEYESGQIILTASEKIDSYDVEKSDLTCGDEKILASDIEIYAEGYVYVKNDHFYVSGLDSYYVNDQYVPDFLVPFDSSKKAKENTIEKDCNQGLYVTVRTSKETVAGTYTGTFAITADGTKYSVPVKVTVADVTISDEVNTASSFLLYNDYLLNSIEGSTTSETLRAYYDFFLEHRLSLMYLPTTSNDVDEFLSLLREYHDHPAFTAYEIPYSWSYYFDYSNVELQNGYYQPDLTKLQDTVYKIVSMSIEDGVNYLEKGYVYNLYTDEFLLQMSATNTKFEMGKKWGSEFAAWRKEATEALDVAYGKGYLDSVEGLRYSLENLTILNPGSDVQIGNHIPEQKFDYNSVMPEPDLFNNPGAAESVKNTFSEEGDEFWWYTCVGPVAPYPNYHLANSGTLLGARLLSWMQYDYDIYGNLYYLVNIWNVSGDLRYDQQMFTGHAPNTNEDNHGAYGDGLLIYPGAQYGLKEPVSTLRLESIRDGLEDYALLEAVEKEYFSLSEFYATELSVDEFYETIFASLYSGAKPYRQTDNLKSARETLADTVLRLSSNAKVLVEKTIAEGDYYYADVLVAGDFTVEGDYESKTACGQGYRYSFKYLRGENDVYLHFVAKKGEESYTTDLLLERAPVTITTYDKEADLETLSFSKNTQASIATVDGIAVTKVTLASSAKASEIARFKPMVTMNPDALKSVADVANEYTVNLYNAYDEDVVLVIKAVTKTKETILKTIDLKAKSWNEVVFSDVASIKNAVKLTFEFENVVKSEDGKNTAVNYDVYFSKLAYRY